MAECGRRPRAFFSLGNWLLWNERAWVFLPAHTTNGEKSILGLRTAIYQDKGF